MLQAYVGIVSRQGLEIFTPENPQTVRFLSRRAQREAGRVACFWSVVPDDTAGQIHAALRQGRGGEALALLQHQARDYGFLLPCDDVEPSATEIYANG